MFLERCLKLVAGKTSSVLMVSPLLFATYIITETEAIAEKKGP